MSDELLKSEPIYAEFQNKSVVTLVNPNFDRVHHDQNFDFLPFVKYYVDEPKARIILAHSRECIEMRNQQRADERQAWAGAAISIDPKKRDAANRWCDEKGNPRSPAFKRPLIVDYNTEEGKKAVKEGIDEAIKAGFDFATGKVRSVSVSEQHEEQPEFVASAVELESPKQEWEKDKLIEYITAISGVEPPPSYHSNKTLLTKRANEAFSARKEQFTAAGVNFREV